ncbi:MAG: hypothetical protein LBR22_08450 [Desulfovibrio sp.]|nr:hypothetical protein [Desulfovibrio sp.]
MVRSVVPGVLDEEDRPIPGLYRERIAVEAALRGRLSNILEIESGKDMIDALPTTSHGL